MVRGSIKIIKCFAVPVFYQWLIWAVADEPTQLSYKLPLKFSVEDEKKTQDVND